MARFWLDIRQIYTSIRSGINYRNLCEMFIWKGAGWLILNSLRWLFNNKMSFRCVDFFESQSMCRMFSFSDIILMKAWWINNEFVVAFLVSFNFHTKRLCSHDNDRQLSINFVFIELQVLWRLSCDYLLWYDYICQVGTVSYLEPVTL